MTSKYQKKPSFSVDKLGKMQSINIDFNNQPFTFQYKELELVVINNQLCWKYEDSEDEIFMPICRKSTIDKLFEEKE